MSGNGIRGGSTYVNAQRLLKMALNELDNRQLVRSIGVPSERLRRWATSGCQISLEEQTAIAVAVLAMAPQESRLFSGAMALRNRLRAELEYTLGVTRATVEPPRIRLEDR